MISECLVWYGIFSEIYQDELTEWEQDNDDFDAPEHIRCDEFDLEDEELFYTTFTSASMFGERTLVLRNCEEWPAATVKKALSLLEDTDGEFRVSMLYQGREITSSIEPFVTEVLDRRIQFQDPQDMADWLMTYFEDHGLSITGDDAYSVAEHVGRTVNSVQTLVRVAISTVNNHPTDTVTYRDLLSSLGGVGEVEMYNLSSAIASGDRSYSREIVERLEGIHHPLKLLSFLKSRYRNYLIIYEDDSNETLNDLNVKRGAARYLRSEARTLGMRRLLRSIEEINQADNNMKGGIDLPSQLQFSMLVDTLTNHFRNALKRSHR